MPTSRWLASTGNRLALVQAVVLIAVFLVAGTLVYVATGSQLHREAAERARAEALSLHGGFLEDGLGNVREAIDHRLGRGSGLHYRLVDPAGHLIKGDLPAASYRKGAEVMRLPLPGDPVADPIPVFTIALGDQARLSVGQDMEFAERLLNALVPILVACGLAGAIGGVVLSSLLNRGVARRIDRLAQTAHAVSSGDLSVRVGSRARTGHHADDIDMLTTAIDDMLDEIARLVANIRQVSADVAHDLRTPLSRVRQRMEVLRLEATGHPAMLATIQRVDDDLEGLLRVFAAMLRLSEIETGANRLEIVPFNLANSAHRIVDVYRPDVEDGGRSLILTARSAMIAGDEALIGQAIANLIENAMRHTPVGSTIRLDVERGENQVTLRVADDGPGIPKVDRSRVLQRFVRLERSRTTPGSGLGLALVAAVARRHDATLTLADAGPGLSVSLAFPLTQRDGAAEPCKSL